MEESVLRVSRMTGKLEGFQAINFDTLSSPFCSTARTVCGSICEKCYSAHMLQTFRSTCIKPWKSNAELMRKDLEDWQIPRFRPNSDVRLLGHGDVDCMTQASNFIRIALANPTVRFVAWSKNIIDWQDAVRLLGKPSNLRLIRSSVFIDERGTLPEPFDGIFTVYSKAENIPVGDFHCSGKKCADCMNCYGDDFKSNIGEVLNDRWRYEGASKEVGAGAGIDQHRSRRTHR